MVGHDTTEGGRIFKGYLRNASSVIPLQLGKKKRRIGLLVYLNESFLISLSILFIFFFFSFDLLLLSMGRYAT